MMRAALESISGSNEVRHLFIELIGSEYEDILPSFFFRSHFFFVKIDISNVFHMLILAPLSIFFSWNVS